MCHSQLIMLIQLKAAVSERKARKQEKMKERRKQGKTKWKSSKFKRSSSVSEAAMTVFPEVSWQVGRGNVEVLG